MNYQCDLIEIIRNKIHYSIKTHSLNSQTFNIMGSRPETENKFHKKILIPKKRKVKMLAKRV